MGNMAMSAPRPLLRQLYHRCRSRDCWACSPAEHFLSEYCGDARRQVGLVHIERH
jgi:hypothetical protein